MTESKTSRTDWSKVLSDLPVSWQLKRLKHIVDITNSNVDKKTYEDGTQVRLCNYVDVYYNEFVTDDLDFMKATATESEIERFSLLKDDVLITKDSETWDDIAVPALVVDDLPGVVCGYHLTMLRPKDGEVDGRFLLRALQASGVKEQFHVSAKGITRYGLSQHHIQDAFIPIPPLDEQRQLATYLDRKTGEIDALIRQYTGGISIKTQSSKMDSKGLIPLLLELRASLISEVVTGKIDIRASVEAEALEPSSLSEAFDI